MSCHYSCATCISQLFADKCLSCPATRQLVDTSCFCMGSYLEYQQTTCTTLDELTRPDYFFYQITQIVYWVMLGFSWLTILGNINHMYSAKVRVLVGWSQLLGLLLQYRFRFAVLAEKALDVFGVWNFRYFDKLICTQKSKPYQCQTYQNFLGPLLTLAVFFLTMIVSYILTKTCVLSIFTESQQNQPNQPVVGEVLVISRTKQTHQSSSTNSIKSMSFGEYFRISMKQFFFLYFDYTVIQWTVQLSRIAYVNTFLFLIYIPILVFLMLYSLYALRVINSQSQFKVQYRSQLGYFYIYDKRYYLNYLDYLFEEDKKTKKKGYQPERYLPQSNFLVIQIFAKFFIAATTIMMFEYKPQIWVFPTLFALLVGFIKLKVFQIYEREAFLVYILGFFLYLIAVALFFLQYFFTIWMNFLMLVVSAAYVVLLISEISDWTREKEGKYWAVAYEYLHGQTEDEKHPIELQKIEHQNQQDQDEQNSLDNLVKATETKFNGTNKSKQGSQEPSKTKSALVSNNFMSTKPNFKKNVNFTQENLSQTQIVDRITPDTQTNQNLKPNSAQSFLGKTNKSKFAGVNSNDTFQNNSRPNISPAEGSFRAKNGDRHSQIDKLPEIIEEDRQDSVDGRSNQDLNRKTEHNNSKNMIQDLQNNHQNMQPSNRPSSQQNGALRGPVKLNKTFKYKK